MPDFIDTHSHVNFDAYDADRDEVVSRSLSQNTWFINVGTDKDTSASAVALANAHDKGVFAIIGEHPVQDSFKKFDYDFYKNLAQDKKVLAIGECGLDYFRSDKATADAQKEIFEAQISLAIELDKPLMLHIRNAHKDALEVLKKYPKARGNVHFFAGTWEEAKGFLDIGFTLSFTGVITFARDYDEVIKNTPLEMILSETDCPYVTPAPHRGKRNEPVFVQEVVKKIAEIKGLELETVKKALISNAFRVFDFSSFL